MPVTIREQSTQQFADGTNIGGSRLDRMLRDVQARWNAVRKRDRTRWFFMDTIVGGYMGSRFPALNPPTIPQRILPWLNYFNQAVDTVGAFTFQNTHRVKGFRNDAIDPTGDPAVDTLRLWTTAYVFKAPVTITALSFSLTTDGADFVNNFLYGAGTAFPGGSVRDIYIELSVDDPFAADDRTLNNPEIHLLRFAASSVFFTPLPVVALYADFLPAHPIPPGGVLIDLQNLNVPIPRDSRVRLTLCIPQYDMANATKNTTGWGNAAVPASDSWRRQYYSFTLTVASSVVQ